MRIIIFIFLLFSFCVKAQTVEIYCATTYAPSVIGVRSAYEASFGVGNVNITQGATLADYSLYDVVIFNSISVGYTALDLATLTAYVQSGGHVILSTEGGTLAGGGYLMSSVWNAITGQAITETAAHAAGTGSPPRFHNSNGPWQLSPDPNLTSSTTSYASFASLNPLNVTHQRNLVAPTCDNVEGLSAAFPARPNLGDGTLYIQGEIQYPFYIGAGSAEVAAHARALAQMHYALLTNDQVLLTQLNTWQANLVVNENFLGADQLVCSSSFVPFIEVSPVYSSYSWEDLSGNVLGTSQSYTISDSGSYILKSVGTFPQCDGVDTIKIEFKSVPVSKFLADTVCLGKATSFTNNSTIALPDIVSATDWDFGDGGNDNTLSPVHTYILPGLYNVKLTSSTGVVPDLVCSHDTTITVVVHAEPLAKFTVSNGCLYDAPVFTESSTVTSGNITTWEWNFGDVLPATTVQSTAQVPSHTYTAAGNYQVSLIVTTDKGCDDTLIKTTVRNPIPNLNFSAAPACKNDSVVFINTSTIQNISLPPATGDVINSWIWNYGDGSVLSSQKARKHKYTQDGFFNVTLIGSSNKGCVKDSTIRIQVYPLPVANFTSTSSCENGNATNFFDASSVSLGNVTNYSWDFGHNGATANTQFSQHKYDLAGTYNIELAIESNFGCKDTVWKDIEIHPKPEALFIADATEGCFPYCTNFTDNSTSNATSITNYFWIFGNGEVRTTASSQICFENISHIDDALYSTTLIVTNDFGCKDTLVETDFITVWPKPLADFELDPRETNMYETDIAFTNLSDGGDTYNWYYGDGNTNSVFEENHIYGDTGTYKINLVVLTDNNCVDSIQDEVRIDPLQNVYIPNAFTPNGDGENDFFFIEGFAINYTNFEFTVYDRWGTLIYLTDGNFPWDGTFKGDLAPQDSYVYKVSLLDLKGKRKEFEGHFILLR